MTKKTIQIIIASDQSREPCPAQCGIDWSAPEALARARQHLKAKFGGRVSLAYLDLATAGASPVTGELQPQARNLPLLLINGQPRISGPFDLRMLADTVEAEMEMVLK